jgi:hypothetical protein
MLPLRTTCLLGMVVHAYNPRTQKAEAAGSPVQCYPGLQSKTLSQKPKQNVNNKQKCA